MIWMTSAYNSNEEYTGQKVSSIKDRDNQQRDKFIKDYMPFIVRVISNTVPGKKGLKHRDEYSIGLIAFNEAIDRFDSSRYTQAFNFFSFAERIIKNRIIDYLRTVSRRSMEIPVSYLEENEDTFYDNHLNKPCWEVHDRMELFEEIKGFIKELGNWGLKLGDLNKYAPKHIDSRQKCVCIAKRIAAHKPIYQEMIRKKRLPMKELLKIVDVCPRTIQRNKVFIISISIIYGNDYEHLQSYLGGMIY